MKTVWQIVKRPFVFLALFVLFIWDMIAGNLRRKPEPLDSDNEW